MSSLFPPPACRIPDQPRSTVQERKRPCIPTEAVRFLLPWFVAALAAMNAEGAPKPSVPAPPRWVRRIVQDPPANMVSWWEAENNTNDSAGANQAALASGATYGTGKVGQAFSFDGVDAYASVPASSAWAFGTGNFTLEFWVFRTTDDDRRPLINNRSNAGTENMWAIEIYSLANRVEFHSGVTILLQATNLLASTSWNHVALTRSGTTLSFYINGVLSG
ncbi:MAG: LamG domain-containing protein, partial [Betaproteobacteria bacterium]|nr:LamG domain-containing protein [Betaproteobacteria bacterium]